MFHMVYNFQRELTYDATRSDGHVTQRVLTIVSESRRLQSTHLKSNLDPNKRHTNSLTTING